MSKTVDRPKRELHANLSDGHDHDAHVRAKTWVSTCVVCVAEMALEGEEMVCNHGMPFFSTERCACDQLDPDIGPRGWSVPDCAQCRAETRK